MTLPCSHRRVPARSPSWQPPRRVPTARPLLCSPPRRSCPAAAAARLPRLCRRLPRSPSSSRPAASSKQPAGLRVHLEHRQLASGLSLCPARAKWPSSLDGPSLSPLPAQAPLHVLSAPLPWLGRTVASSAPFVPCQLQSSCQQAPRAAYAVSTRPPAINLDAAGANLPMCTRPEASGASAHGRLLQRSLSCIARPVRFICGPIGGPFLLQRDFSRCSSACTPSVHP